MLPVFVRYKGWDVCACILVAVDGVTNAVNKQRKTQDICV
jgi:hypothetical protein